MRRLFIAFSMIFVLFLITACGESEDLGGEVSEEAEEEQEVEEANSDNQAEGNEEEINEVIVDDDVKVTLEKIAKESDDIFGESYEIIFDVENSLDHSIEVQARSVSIDGTMVDEATYSMSQEVAPDKNAEAVLSIEDFDDEGLPEMEEEFEMTLHLTSFDNMDYSEDHEIKVEF